MSPYQQANVVMIAREILWLSLEGRQLTHINQKQHEIQIPLSQKGKHNHVNKQKTNQHMDDQHFY